MENPKEMETSSISTKIILGFKVIPLDFSRSCVLASMAWCKGRTSFTFSGEIKGCSPYLCSKCILNLSPDPLFPMSQALSCDLCSAGCSDRYSLSSLEYWSFEAIVIFSGLLPNSKLETSTMALCLSTCSTLYMIPFGIGATISTRVSNELGAGNPQGARFAVFVTLAIGTVEALLMGTCIVLLKNIWSQAVSKDLEVISKVASLMPLIAVVQIIDAYQCVLAGIVRGCGWQNKSAIVGLGSYYLVGLPISILLAFKLHMGGKGLWTGIICALLVQVFLLGIITIRNSWEKEVRKALERVQSCAPVGNIVNPEMP